MMADGEAHNDFDFLRIQINVADSNDDDDDDDDDGGDDDDDGDATDCD